MRKVTLAALQMACSWELDENLEKMERLIREAAAKGANIILPQELYSGIYFCQEENYDYFKLAHKMEESPSVLKMQSLAKELGVVIPASFFEKANEVYYNSAAIIDADGAILGKYRKSHIPDDPGYLEKFYFTPGDTGFRVWDTKFGKIGVGICWDQWFPEAARCMALQGAEILLYPTAIGTDPEAPDKLDRNNTKHKRWQNAMLGHSIADCIPVVASNRTGIETIGDSSIRFFGASFISNDLGELIAEMDQFEEGVITAEIDLDAREKLRVLRYRDRRTDLYGPLLTKDGITRM